MARDAAGWLDRRGLFARTVVIKVRYDDFTTITRSHSVPIASRDRVAIVTRALALLDKTKAGSTPVRLLGVSVHNLMDTPEVPRPTHEDRGGPRLPFDEPCP
jgi:DNA polymerase-4